MERREKTVIIVLFVVLFAALLLMVVGTQREADIGTIETETEAPAPGRSVTLDELRSRCLSFENRRVVIDGVPCRVEVAATEEPYWNVPLLHRWLPRESRRLDLSLLSSSCFADVEFDTGEIEYRDVELDAETESASLAVRSEGGELRVRRLGLPGSGCQLEIEGLS